MTDEPPRPVPDFLIIVFRDGSETDVTDAVIDAYDVAVNSLDFGSGFLSTEEAASLRHLGAAMGAGPLRYCSDMCKCGHQYNWHITRRGCGGNKCRCQEYEEAP